MKKYIAIILSSLTLALAGAGIAGELLEEGTTAVNASTTSVTYDLSDSSNVSSASAEALVFKMGQTTVTFAKGSSNTDANKYYAGNNKSKTKVFAGGIQTYDAGDGYYLDSVVITLGSATTASNMASSTWTNATAAANGVEATASSSGDYQSFKCVLSANVFALKIVMTYHLAPVVTSVKITKNPAKIAYKVGETLELDGMEVEASCDDGKTYDVTTEATTNLTSDYVFQEADVGTKTLTATYDKKSDSVKLSVEVATIASLHTDVTTAESGSFSVTGTITRILDEAWGSKSYYIQDGGYAVKVENVTAVADAAIGKTVTLVSTFIKSGGLLKTSTFDSLTVTGTGTVPAALTVDEAGYDATALSEKDSVLVDVSGLSYVSGTPSTGITATLGSTSVSILSMSPTASSAMNGGVTSFFSKLGSEPFVFTGVLGNNGGLYFSITKASDLHSDEVDHIDALVTLLHMDSVTENQCQSLFAAAKTSYDSLSDAERSMFASNSGYADAYARYMAWSRAYVENSGSVSLLKEQSLSETSIVTIILISTLGALGAVLLLRKRHAA